MTSTNELPPRMFELDRWLDVATHGLCAAAKARVRAEVEAHFAAAYEDALAENVNTAAANVRALMALGDPKKARPKFQRTYLTTGDETRLLVLANRWNAIGSYIFFLGLPLIAFGAKEVSLWVCVQNVLWLPATACLLTPGRGISIRRLRSVQTVQVVLALIQAAWLLATLARFDVGLSGGDILVAAAALTALMSSHAVWHWRWRDCYHRLLRTKSPHTFNHSA